MFIYELGNNVKGKPDFPPMLNVKLVFLSHVMLKCCEKRVINLQ